MSRRASLVVVCCVVSVLQVSGGAAQRPTAAPQTSFAQPGISPDGSTIAFVSAGDIWYVSAAGGDARLLVSHPATEERPLYSPDGTRLAFMSNRAGTLDVWVLTLNTGALQQITTDDGVEQLDAWSPDGEWIYFSSNAIEDLNVYRVRAAGGTPMPVAAAADAYETMAAPAPDGRSVVVAGHGTVAWTRRGRSHADETELWRVSLDGPGAPVYTTIQPGGAKQQWPAFDANGSLYFVSDRNGEQNLWMRPRGGPSRAITSFTTGRVTWPTVAREGAIAFERDFGIWVYPGAGRPARPVAISLRGAINADTVEHLSLTSGFSDLAVSPDGKKLAFVARGEVFAASAAEGGDAVRVSASPAAEEEPTWSPDSRRIVYSSNRAGVWQLFLYDFATATETALTGTDADARAPRFSPDGTSIAFVRGAAQLCVVAIGTRTVKPVATGFFGRPPSMSAAPIAWSPDGRWLAFLSAGPRMFLNAWIVPASGGEPRQVTWLANAFAWPYQSSLAWSADGTFLVFNTGARTEPGQVARVDLVPPSPRFREDQFSALFGDQPQAPARTAAAPPAVRVDFDGIRERLRLLPIGLDVAGMTLAPDGTSVVVTAPVAEQPHLFSYSLDDPAGTPAARQLTTTAAAKSDVQFSADGRSVWYLEGGRPVVTVIEPRSVRTVAVRAEMDVDFGLEKWEVFHQAWEYLNANFYDDTFHGVDWPSVRARYAPLVAGAQTRGELRRLLTLMIGELNASHSGIQPPAGAAGPAIGRLGIDFDRLAYETRGQFVVSDIVPRSPADLEGAIRIGDVVTAIDGHALGRQTNLHALLSLKSGRKVVLTLAPEPGTTERRQVAVRPVTRFVDNDLRYVRRVKRRRELVSRLSNGRLGYVHIPALGPAAPAQFAMDLDAEMLEKDGVILDVRNNGGGFTNGHVLDFLLRKPYVNMIQRGAPAVSGRHLLGQRALQAPTILLTNQYSGSDAENFTEGYRVLGLGKVIGVPTAGADVFTTAGLLVDGSRVRLPYITNAQLDQTPLERVPRPVDIHVPAVPGESYQGTDAQLEAAVRELLKQIATAGTTSRGGIW